MYEITTFDNKDQVLLSSKKRRCRARSRRSITTYNAICPVVLSQSTNLNRELKTNPKEYPRIQNILEQDSDFLPVVVSIIRVLCSGYRGVKLDLRRHWVAAPLSKLSIVAHTTTRFPLEWTAKPPISTPWRPAMFFTRGASPTILTSFSPAYRSWYRLRISREVISSLSGRLIACYLMLVAIRRDSSEPENDVHECLGTKRLRGEWKPRWFLAAS